MRCPNSAPRALVLSLLGLLSPAIGDARASTPWLRAAESASADRIAHLRGADLWVGGVVGLYDRGRRSLRAYGESGGPAPLSLGDAYEIGSVSKAFTGILLARAVRELPGLSLEDPLAKFLPELRNPFTAALTLRQLATHTAGLPDDPPNLFAAPDFDAKNPYGNYSEAELLQFLATAQPDPKLVDPAHPGRYHRAYSNCGFATLGLVLEKIHGAAFDTLIETQIARPLRMSHTFVNRADTRAPSRFLTPFGITGDPVNHMAAKAYAAAGAIVSTLPDMLRFLRANLRAAHAARGKLAAAMRLSQREGLGWDSFPGDRIIMKNGQTLGFSAFIAFDPATSRGTIELSNLYSIFSDWIAALPIQPAAVTSDQIFGFTQAAFDRSTVALSEDARKKLVGVYTGTDGTRTDHATLKARDRSLTFSVGGSPIGVVLSTVGKPDPYWLYQGAEALGMIAPVLDAAGGVSGFRLRVTDAQGNVVATENFTREPGPLF